MILQRRKKTLLSRSLVFFSFVMSCKKVLTLIQTINGLLSTAIGYPGRQCLLTLKSVALLSKLGVLVHCFRACVFSVTEKFPLSIFSLNSIQGIREEKREEMKMHTATKKTSPSSKLNFMVASPLLSGKEKNAHCVWP